MSQICFLTTEQEALIHKYQQKWRDVYLSTEPLDRDRASEAVKQAYRLIGKDEPEIIFCSSPIDAVERLQAKMTKIKLPEEYKDIEQFTDRKTLRHFVKFWLKSMLTIFRLNAKQKKARTKVITKLFRKISQELYRDLEQHINNIVPDHMTNQEIVAQSFIGDTPLFSKSEQQKILSQDSNFKQHLSWLPGHQLIYRRSLKKRIARQIRFKVIGTKHPDLANTMQLALTSMQELSFLATQNPIRMSELTISLIWVDFAFSVLNYSCNRNYLSILKNLILQCHWLFIVGKQCFIGERPQKIVLDKDNKLHGNGESALELANGHAFYFYHGVSIPKQYGEIPYYLWQSQWVAEEELKPLKELLIKEIGVDRLSQELPLVQLESKGEYTLFRLDNEINTKVIHILKRVVQETGEIKTATVSWTKQTLERAIKYAHENISAEDFTIPND